MYYHLFQKKQMSRYWENPNCYGPYFLSLSFDQAWSCSKSGRCRVLQPARCSVAVVVTIAVCDRITSWNRLRAAFFRNFINMRRIDNSCHVLIGNSYLCDINGSIDFDISSWMVRNPTIFDCVSYIASMRVKLNMLLDWSIMFFFCLVWFAWILNLVCIFNSIVPFDNRIVVIKTWDWGTLAWSLALVLTGVGWTICGTDCTCCFGISLTWTVFCWWVSFQLVQLELARLLGCCANDEKVSFEERLKPRKVSCRVGEIGTPMDPCPEFWDFNSFIRIWVEHLCHNLIEFMRHR